MGNNYKKARYTKLTGFRLSPVCKSRLEKIAAWEGVEMAAVIRRLINKEYQEHKQEIEESLKNIGTIIRKE